MPLEKEEFNEFVPEKSLLQKVREILQTGKAYKIGEVAEMVNRKPQAIASYFAYFLKHNLVEHKRPYWKWRI